MMKYFCHHCEELSGLIVLVNGGGVCPRCYKNLYLNEKSLPKPILKKLKPITKINTQTPLDMMQALLISWFLQNGMTISNIARQLGLTRSTIYAKLRKYNLWKPDDEHKLTVTPSDDDLLACGHVCELKDLKALTHT